MYWVFAFLTVALLAGLIALMAAGPLRDRVLGKNPTLNALVPITAAGLAWVATFLGGLARGVISDNTPPAESLAVFVEDISFGFPELDDYQSHSLSGEEIKRILAPFNELSDQTINLADDERARINEIANQSGQLKPVPSATVTDLAKVATYLRDAISVYYEYRNEWSTLPSQWAREIEAGVAAGEGPVAILATFVERLEGYQRGAGLFQGMIGMDSQGTVSLDTDSAEGCSRVEVPWVRYSTVIPARIGGPATLGFLFPKFRMPLVRENSSENRLESAAKLADLFKQACVQKIAAVLDEASQVFSFEADLMARYVEVWNDILGSRRSNKLSLRVTISNVGKYDSFVRRTGKIAVGPKGRNKDKIEVLIGADEEEDDEGGDTSPFLSIPSRSTITRTFTAHLTEETSERLHGTYVGGLNFLKLGVRASAGKYEGEFRSPPTPFSDQARKQVEARIEQMDLEL